jgi:hypothetical protein
MPLLLYQPIAYAGFGICYGVTRLIGVQSSSTKIDPATAEQKAADRKLTEEERKRSTFDAMALPQAAGLRAEGSE